MQNTATAGAVTETAQAQVSGPQIAAVATALPILILLSISHLLNDVMQSLVQAIYPLIKDAQGLDYTQIGMITFVFQVTASVFQPFVGMYTDRSPKPYSMVAGMAFTLVGLITLGYATSYPVVLLAAALVGTGSSIFHPEATRIARMASGGRQGFAQSLFQLGGQGGSALGPLLAAWVVVPRGQRSVVVFAGIALVAMLILSKIGAWYKEQLAFRPAKPKAATPTTVAGAPSPRVVVASIALLIVLMFSKNAYTSSLSSFYTFYAIDRFKVSVETSQYMLFAYLASNAVGVLIGGPLGDRIGRRRIIWASILGALPFTLLLPYANLYWTVALTMMIGIVMASAFAAILIYAMELLPGRVGLIGGLFYGLTFGLGGISAAMLGVIADKTSIGTVFWLCSFLPLIGLLTWFLPELRKDAKAA
jgi:MFS transporter, FSR family, fosmidomycin resistance protein